MFWSHLLTFTLIMGGAGLMNAAENNSFSGPYKPLSDEEKAVIEHKATERPGTGKYLETSDSGVYACRKCGAPLYVSDDKFNSGCGWPAFDDELPGAVRRVPDADGNRTEIVCARCGAHLGHVFRGEGLTPRDTRHCVNSISLVFEPQETGRLRRAVFAGGCFWGVEALMKTRPGVVTAVSGYSGGPGRNPPSYPEVCTGKTGHAESVEIVYDASKTDFETLCKYFLEIHDPTQKNRQGPDYGTQYRSVIFYLDDEQKKTAGLLLDYLRKHDCPAVTELVPFRRFWNAEGYHQDYFGKHGQAPFCHGRTVRFPEK